MQFQCAENLYESSKICSKSALSMQLYYVKYIKSAPLNCMYCKICRSDECSLQYELQRQEEKVCINDEVPQDADCISSFISSNSNVATLHFIVLQGFTKYTKWELYRLKRRELAKSFLILFFYKTSLKCSPWSLGLFDDTQCESSILSCQGYKWCRQWSV